MTKLEWVSAYQMAMEVAGRKISRNEEWIEYVGKMYDRLKGAPQKQSIYDACLTITRCGKIESATI